MSHSVGIFIWQEVFCNIGMAFAYLIKTAKELGISRNRLYKKMQALGIE